ncbi:MAG: radical SAM protein [Magnetococcales bacterium]|nr:radical SAM protein [Magnetococcales bacterium]
MLTVKMLYVGTSLPHYGARMVWSVLHHRMAEASLHVVLTQNLRSIRNLLNPGRASGIGGADYDLIAQEFRTTALLAISSMSEEADHVKQIIAAVRRVNPKIYVVWGGIHCIVAPEDAIPHADAICTSEGEAAFEAFLQNFSAPEQRRKVENFWFREQGQVIKNPFRPLLTSAELDALPVLVYGINEFIYRRGQGFSPVTSHDYLQSESMAMDTLWTRGCPFKCTYCSNTRFLAMDRNYGKLRYPSIQQLIRNVRSAIEHRPYIMSVTFHDDGFIALPVEVMREFVRVWREEINLPFCVQGVNPIHVDQEKMALLVDGGMNRLRMGIQSGSDRILKFYHRPNRPDTLPNAVKIIHSFRGRIMPPAYDIIVDNPIETNADIQDTLRMVNRLPRPFTINLFSLRAIPNTELEEQFKNMGELGDINTINKNYGHCAPTFANALLHLLVIMKIPDGMLNRLLPFAVTPRESPREYNTLLSILRFLMLVGRALSHIRHLDFSIVLGPTVYYLCQYGLLGRKRRQLVLKQPVEKL